MDALSAASCLINAYVIRSETDSAHPVWIYLSHGRSQRASLCHTRVCHVVIEVYRVCGRPIKQPHLAILTMPGRERRVREKDSYIRERLTVVVAETVIPAGRVWRRRSSGAVRKRIIKPTTLHTSREAGELLVGEEVLPHVLVCANVEDGLSCGRQEMHMNSSEVAITTRHSPTDFMRVFISGNNWSVKAPVQVRSIRRE